MRDWESTCSGIADCTVAGAEVGYSAHSADPLVPAPAVRLPAVARVPSPGVKAGAPAFWPPRTRRTRGVNPWSTIGIIPLSLAMVAGVARRRTEPVVRTPGTTSLERGYRLCRQGRCYV